MIVTVSNAVTESDAMVMHFKIETTVAATVMAAGSVECSLEDCNPQNAFRNAFSWCGHAAAKSE